ncbi:MAG: hypothetical protein HGB12_14870 [Bacteroidetes bacterium]|nr:hypothetical protein [Bacteroidota bacterium]
MLNSYLFIPANKQHFINKVNLLNADYFIFDVEESVSYSEQISCIENLKKIDLKSNYFIRPPLFSAADGKINTVFIHNLIEIGFLNFVLPKITELSELILIKNLVLDKYSVESKQFRFIVLIENPMGLLNLLSIVRNSPIVIDSIGIGSHDYCNAMGMQHTAQNLYFAKHSLLNIGKAFNINTIDTVSTIFNDEISFEQECKDAYSMGFDGKFLIHPNQLKVLQNTKYYTVQEIDEALKVYEKMKNIDVNDFSIVEINGKIFERPHLKRILKIVKWKNNYDSK